MCGIRFHDFVDWLWYLIYMQYVGNDILELIITIIWCMWYNRNKVRVGQPRQTSNEILHKARGLLCKFQLAHYHPPQHRDAMVPRWIPPSPPWNKINVDVTIFDQLNFVGVGVLIRDHEGSVVAAMSKHLPLPLGLLEAEGKAMDEAVTFAWDIGVRDVVFETDSQIGFNALSRTITPPIAIANLIDGIHHKLHSFRAALLQSRTPSEPLVFSTY
ncbi:hypothetical protein SO802_023263 [Lithocarpus litseifolius]|uniref:RNase H type-1 domain-containing protein n=1 Tax=Lithocarpus litseifolius TaxID=425828 RepID=A0AAW2C5R0_9ROSI